MENNLFRSDFHSPVIVKADRVVRQIIRSAERDGNGAKLNPRGADLRRYQLNPVVLYEHTSGIVGRAVRIEMSNDVLVADIEYATSALAEEVYQLDRSGFMPGASIGWKPLEFEVVKDGIDVSKWELYEISKVHVPADLFAVRA